MSRRDSGRGHVGAMLMGPAAIAGGVYGYVNRTPSFPILVLGISTGVLYGLAGYMIGHRDSARGDQIAASTAVLGTLGNAGKLLEAGTSKASLARRTPYAWFAVANLGALVFYGTRATTPSSTEQASPKQVKEWS